MKILPKILILIFTLRITESLCFAHDYWIERNDSGFSVVYGHRDERLEYNPNDLKKVTLIDSEGKALPFKKEIQSKAMLLFPQGNACLILADLESGYWSKTIYGLKNLPKRKTTRPIESFRAYHFSKSIVSAGNTALKPIPTLKLDVIPIQNPLNTPQMKAGDLLSLRVLYDGKPLIGASVEGDHQKLGETDSDGLIRVTLKKGRQLYTVEKRDPITTDPDADFISTTTTLTFEIR